LILRRDFLAGSSVLLAAPALAKKVDWTKQVRMTPAGGYQVGNPKAGVQLLEFGSYTCGHCGHFHKTAKADLLSKYVASGKVAYEFRSFVRNGVDAALTLVAACQGGPRYFQLSDAIFTDQDNWLRTVATIPADRWESLEQTPPDQRMLASARLAKLDTWFAQRGVAAPQFQACLTNKAAMTRLERQLQTIATRYTVEVTPTFYINGVKYEGDSSWEAVEAALKSLIK
jgi:protein-disulfide isomerase